MLVKIRKIRNLAIIKICSIRKMTEQAEVDADQIFQVLTSNSYVIAIEHNLLA